MSRTPTAICLPRRPLRYGQPSPSEACRSPVLFERLKEGFWKQPLESTALHGERLRADSTPARGRSITRCGLTDFQTQANGLCTPGNRLLFADELQLVADPRRIEQ